MTADMEFEGLIVSRDPALFNTLDRIMRQLSICTNLCLSTSTAVRELEKGSTDLVVIDWQADESEPLFASVGGSKNQNKTTIVAAVPQGEHVSGAHIILNKPVTIEAATQALKTAYSRMLQDHRFHTRYALMIPVLATDHNGVARHLTVADIGDGGVGLSTKQGLLPGDVLRFRLQLPGAPREILVEARVLWSRDYGRAGCEFLRLPPVDLMILHDWLKSKVRVKPPLSGL
jgi:PilZ domain